MEKSTNLLFWAPDLVPGDTRLPHDLALHNKEVTFLLQFGITYKTKVHAGHWWIIHSKVSYFLKKGGGGGGFKGKMRENKKKRFKSY